jgi:hypothetical protein
MAITLSGQAVGFMSNKLIPCPFCRTVPKGPREALIHKGMYVIECLTCIDDDIFISVHATTPDKTILKWNSRVRFNN